MGKHERHDIEQMEKSVVGCINKQSPLITPAHKWYKHMERFVSYINKKYPKIREARHIGNEYRHEVGDVKLIMANGPAHFLELKASETSSGRGTLANISQNAITEYGLLLPPENGIILSWSEFRKEKHFTATVQSLLNSYETKGNLSLGDKARLIRDEAKKGDLLAISIKAKISTFANRDKKEYINYVRNFRSNEQNVIKFTFCLLNGIHRMKKIKSEMARISMAEIKDKYEEMTTLYANLRESEVAITESRSKMNALAEDFERFSFSFPDDTDQVVNTHIIGYDKRSGTQQRLLSLELNWKNVFQGIETPCINVFLGSYFEN
jgi:hypothetical protein